MDIKTLSRDLWLLVNFRNGWEMLSYLRKPNPIIQAKLLDGKTVDHPATNGLVEGIVELWYEKCYFPDGFYSAQSDDVIIRHLPDENP